MRLASGIPWDTPSNDLGAFRAVLGGVNSRDTPHGPARYSRMRLASGDCPWDTPSKDLGAWRAALNGRYTLQQPCTESSSKHARKYPPVLQPFVTRGICARNSTDKLHTMSRCRQFVMTHYETNIGNTSVLCVALLSSGGSAVVQIITVCLRKASPVCRSESFMDRLQTCPTLP